MPTLISSSKDIGFTILPYSLDTPVEELLAHPSKYVVGSITRTTGTNTFTSIEAGSTETNHWSLDIMKELPYSKEKCSWIVYHCSPERTKIEFNKILSKYFQTLHIHNWDTWSVEGNAKVIVVRSWEIY
jgi:hypothetical protein